MIDPLRFRLGERVRIDDARFPDFWPNGVSGVIAAPPAEAAKMAGGWAGHVRMVTTTSGPQPYYWVVLDEARLDSDGDGPYREAEISWSALHALGQS